MPKATTLSCGGKGPCCHVGYSHRHCEHCDVVISTVATVPYYPYWQWFQPNWTYPMYQNTYQIGANQTIGYVNLGGGNHTSENAFSTTPAVWDHTCAALTAGD